MSPARLGETQPTSMTSVHREPRIWIGPALLVAAACLWSLNGLFIKSIHAQGTNPWLIAGLRSLFACLVIAPFAWRRRHAVSDPWWVLAAVLLFTAMCATFVLSTTLTTAANAIVLQYTAPAWVFVFSPMINKERATRAQWHALCASLVGVAIIFLWQYRPGQSGLIIGLVSGIVFGMQSVFFRRIRKLDPLVLVFFACGGSALLLTPIGVVKDSHGITWPIVGWLALMGVVQFGLPYVLYSVALRWVTAQQAVLIILLEAVLNPIWVWWLRDETPHASTLIGGGIIICSVGYQAGLRFARQNVASSR